MKKIRQWNDSTLWNFDVPQTLYFVGFEALEGGLSEFHTPDFFSTLWNRSSWTYQLPNFCTNFSHLPVPLGLPFGNIRPESVEGVGGWVCTLARPFSPIGGPPPGPPRLGKRWFAWKERSGCIVKNARARRETPQNASLRLANRVAKCVQVVRTKSTGGREPPPKSTDLCSGSLPKGEGII